MDWDTSELRTLATALDELAADAAPKARAVIQRGALEIKKAMQTDAEGVAHAPGLPRDISYETEITRDGIEAQVGPTTGDVGSLALLYFGNSKTGPVLKDPVYALEAEAKVVEEFLSRLGDGL